MVRPYAPWSRQSRPATTGDGLAAPRELRSSATLFKLTDRLIATPGSYHARSRGDVAPAADARVRRAARAICVVAGGHTPGKCSRTCSLDRATSDAHAVGALAAPTVTTPSRAISACVARGSSAPHT